MILEPAADNPARLASAPECLAVATWAACGYWEIGTLRQGIEPLALGLELQCAKPVFLPARAHFIVEHAL